MPGRTRALAAIAVTALACLGTVAVSAAPAQAAIEVVYSPLSLGGYCAAKVNSSSTIGFYNGGLSCYRWGTPNLVYAGSGSASAACVYFDPSRTYLSHSQGVSQALTCKYA
ncbi:hypothetical protein C1I98_18645 [Spongiactinospora gelatinilytica]|uniref:Uncharacterized protein n=1 Tax=Spongiactinospora gelatinilytica TaxID=2666298 RepID=A0A2W2G023_9ACTN|nr:hypothetical protein [Spongiactinospora gelatinilytica]PZG43236.1 hypothetical protein C1I98_18645 [Spongiactinospora gelatinilytica]